MSYEKIISKAEELGCKYELNTPMKNYVTMKVGGNADSLVKVNSSDSIKQLVSLAKSEDVPYFVVGNGSNIIVNDNGIKGVVILIHNDFASVTCDDEYIECDAGLPLSKLCKVALDNSLTGLEFAWGIPGSVGGAVYMNAGAYGGEICQVICECEYLDSDLEIKTVKVEDMDLSYRHSMFTDTDKIILKAKFKLSKGNKEEIEALMNKNMTARKTKQPLEYPSSGSTFKRPEGSYASKLIEECGLKGLTVGGAQVSEKHSGFVINIGDATCEDLVNLIALIRQIVYDKTGFILEEEVKFL